MYEDMTIGERIKVLRTCETIRLTLDKFGERLCVKKNTVSQWENNTNKLPDQMFKSICREFGVNEEWLRHGTGDMFVIPEDEDAEIIETLMTEKDDIVYETILTITKAYKKLSPESKSALQSLIQNILEEKENRQA